MNARELRIGNLLWSDNKIIQVECIFSDRGINEEYDHDNGFVVKYDFDEIKAIPLTEEWLLKFGFKLGYNCLGGFHLEFVKYTNYDNIEVRLDYSTGRESEPNLIDHIKYVHQLQNLYFSLTGEELTIKEIAK